MASASNSGIQVLVTANNWSCDLIDAFIGSLDFDRRKSNGLQDLKRALFRIELYIDIERILPTILADIPQKYFTNNQHTSIWIQRALYRINLATLIRWLELDNIYNASKFSLRHVAPEVGFRGIVIQNALIDLKTRLLATMVIDQTENSPNGSPPCDLEQLLTQTLPLDGEAFGLYSDEDQAYIVALVEGRRELITTLHDLYSLDFLVTTESLMKNWKKAITMTMYGISEHEVPFATPSSGNTDNVYIKQEDDSADVYYPAQELFVPQVNLSHQQTTGGSNDDHLKPPCSGFDGDTSVFDGEEYYFSNPSSFDDPSADNDDEEYYLASPIFLGDDKSDGDEQYYLAKAPFDDIGDDNGDKNEGEHTIRTASTSFPEMASNSTGLNSGVLDSLNSSPNEQHGMLSNRQEIISSGTQQMHGDTVTDDDGELYYLASPSIDDSNNGDGVAVGNDGDEQHYLAKPSFDDTGDDDGDKNEGEHTTTMANSNEYQDNVNQYEEVIDQERQKNDYLQLNLDNDVDSDDLPTYDPGSPNIAVERDDDHASSEERIPIIDWNPTSATSCASVDSDDSYTYLLTNTVKNIEETNVFDGSMGDICDILEETQDDGTGPEIGIPIATTNINHSISMDAATTSFTSSAQPRPTCIYGDDDDSQPEYIGTSTMYITSTEALDGDERPLGNQGSCSIEASIFDEGEDTQDGFADESGNGEGARLCDILEETQNDDTGPEIDIPIATTNINHSISMDAATTSFTSSTQPRPTCIYGDDDDSQPEYIGTPTTYITSTEALDGDERPLGNQGSWSIEESIFDKGEDTEDGFADESGNGEGDGDSFYSEEGSFDENIQNTVTDCIEGEDDGVRKSTNALDFVWVTSTANLVDDTTEGDLADESGNGDETDDDQRETSTKVQHTNDDSSTRCGLQDESINDLEDSDDQHEASTETLDKDDDLTTHDQSAVAAPTKNQPKTSTNTRADGEEYQLESDDDDTPYNTDTTIHTQRNQRNNIPKNNNEEHLYISNVNTTSISSTSALATTHEKATSRKRKERSERQGQALDSTLEAESVSPTLAKKRRVIAQHQSQPTPPPASSRKTAPETPPRYFAKRSGPPPAKKTQKQSTEAAASTQHAGEKRRWDRQFQQPTPMAMNTNDSQNEEQDNFDENTDPDHLDKSITTAHTPKRRCLPVATEPQSENVFIHRYNPPLTQREREATRKQNEAQKKQEYKHVVKIEPISAVTSSYLVKQRAQQRNSQLSIKPEPRSTAPSPSSSHSVRYGPQTHQHMQQGYHHASSSSSRKGSGYSKWSEDEVAALREGLGYFQGRQWANILKKYDHRFAPGRTSMDLRDKARNEIKRLQVFGQDLGEFKYAL